MIARCLLRCSSRVGSGLCAVVLPVLLLALVGCTPDAPATDPKPDLTAASGAGIESRGASRSRKQDSCQRSLQGVFDALSPRRIDDDTALDAVVSDLDRWARTCGSVVLEGGFEAIAQDDDVRQQFLDDSLFQRTTSDRYTTADMEHIAEAQFARQIVDAVAGEVAVPSQTQAARTLFDFTVRQIVSVPGLGFSLPIPARLIWQLGFGGTRDRTRLLITVLRQRRIDAALVVVPVDLGEGRIGGYELLGVAVNDAPQPGGGIGNAVLLFDVQNDLAIPHPDDSSRVATLAVGLDNPATWTQFNLGGATYPVTSESLAKRKVKFSASTSLLAPRMGLVQYALGPDQRFELYDSLGPSKLVSEDSGLIARLSRGFDTPTDRIERWDGSEPATDIKLGKEQQTLLGTQLSSLVGPMKAYNTETGWEPRPVRNPLRRGRIEQLTGGSRKAAPVYLQARVAANPLTENDEVPPSLREQVLQMNQRSAVDAEYWNSLLQAESGNTDSAIKLLTRFLQQHPTSFWANSALREVAKLLAGEGRTQDAVAIYAGLPSRSLADLWLLKSWGANVPTTAELQAASETPKPEKKPEPEQEPQPSATGAPATEEPTIDADAIQNAARQAAAALEDATP